MAKILNIRGVDENVAREFAAGAAIRGYTQAEFLKKLLELRMEAALLVLEPSQYRPDVVESKFRAFQQFVTANDLMDKYA